MNRRFSIAIVPLLAALALVSASAAASASACDVDLAIESGQYEYAYAQCKKALEREPSNKQALETMMKLQVIARDLFEEALMLEETEPAHKKELLQTVVLISDPWSELNREARVALGDES